MRPPLLRSGIKITTFTWFGAVLAILAIALPAHADFAMPEVPGFSNNYPWFNNVSQYPGNQSFQYFLAYHPNIAQALARNPSLLYDANWRYQFPALEQYLASHPYEWQALSGEDWAEGLPETPWGGYDQEHQWRDAYWWHANDPNWFYDNHQAWASLDARWLTEDGAYDAQHQWHYGEWWYNQNPNWVAANHPNWLTEHRNWESASEQQSYRKQHTTAAQSRQIQRSSTIERQASTLQANAGRTLDREPEVNRNQKNQQRSANPQHQQQAERERSPVTRRQPEPAVHKGDKQQEASRQQPRQEPNAAHQEQGQHDQKGEK